MTTKPTVLFVDDEPNVLRSYNRVLRGGHFEVRLAASGAEAIKLLVVQPVQLILSDFKMPGMNGLEFLREIRKQDPKVVCAILSGFADEASVLEALRRDEIQRFLLKPIDNDSLKKEVRELLELYPRAKE